MRPETIVIAVMIALGVAGAALAQPARYEHTVYLHEYSGGLHIVPEEINARVGDTLVLNVLNQGATSHNLRVCGDSPPAPSSECKESWGQTKFSIAPSETTLLTIEAIAKAGTFEYYCYIPGHKSGGMVGELRVQGGEEKGGIPGLGAAGLATAAALAVLLRRARA